MDETMPKEKTPEEPAVAAETAQPAPDPKGPASCPDGLPANVKVSFSMRVGGKERGTGGQRIVSHRTGVGGGPG